MVVTRTKDQCFSNFEFHIVIFDLQLYTCKCNSVIPSVYQSWENKSSSPAIRLQEYPSHLGRSHPGSTSIWTVINKNDKRGGFQLTLWNFDSKFGELKIADTRILNTDVGSYCDHFSIVSSE